MHLENDKNILMLVNHDVVIYNFRLELIEKFLNEGYKVYVSSPYGERIEDLIKLGCHYLPIKIDRHGMNPLRDINLLNYYRKIIKKICPVAVLTYTIKPNIYGGLAAKFLKVPYITNITGLGSSIENKSFLNVIVIFLYRLTLSKLQYIYFQNSENVKFFLEHNLISDNYKLLPGSGVNLERFSYLNYPVSDTIEFVFISRLMKEKGIDEYLEAARSIRLKYPNSRFHICGFCEDNYEHIISEYEKKSIIIYHGMVRNVTDILKNTHCTILPSYYEGMSNSLLESAASGRPIIASRIAGCKEIFDENLSGFGVEARNTNDLINKIEKFIHLSFDEKKKMGENARKKMEDIFDRNIIVNSYLEQVHRIEEKNHEFI